MGEIILSIFSHLNSFFFLKAKFCECIYSPVYRKEDVCLQIRIEESFSIVFVKKKFITIQHAQIVNFPFNGQKKINSSRNGMTKHYWDKKYPSPHS